MSGVTATESDNITCDSADSIGITIQQQLNGMRFIDMSIKKKDTVKTLSQLSCAGQSVDRGLVDFDITALFHRLILLVERSTDIIPYFQYELTATPSSVFSGNCMNKPVKPALAKVIRQSVTTTRLQSIRHVGKWKNHFQHRRSVQDFVLGMRPSTNCSSHFRPLFISLLLIILYVSISILPSM